VAGAISGEIKSLCGDKCNKAKGNTPSTTTGGTTDSIPAKVAAVEQNTKEAKEDLAATTKREQCLNGAADALAKNALQKVADKTVNWVKTGFNGNPFYVRDTTSYLKSIENEKLHTYLNKYVQTSDPVFGNALRSVLKQQTTGYTDGFLNKAMNTPEGRAYQDFQSDFTQGGWNAFLNPNNNPVGAYFNAANELSYIINTAQQDVKDELQQGNGFLSMKKCVEYEPIIKTSRPRTCNGGTPEDELLPGTTCVPDQTTTSTPSSNTVKSPKDVTSGDVIPYTFSGSINGDTTSVKVYYNGSLLVDKKFSTSGGNASIPCNYSDVNCAIQGLRWEAYVFGICGENMNCKPSTYKESTTNTTSTASTTTTISSKPPKCIRYETVTPGALISNQMASIANSTIRQLENTDKINQVLGSFFNQFIDRLLTDGVTGSGRGTSRATTGGGVGTNVVIGSNGLTLSSAAACQTPLGYDPATGGFNDELDISRPQQLRAIIIAQKNFLTRSQDAQFVMKKVVPTLGALDYCIPGPNPTWNNNLNENAETFVTLLEEVYEMNRGYTNFLNHFTDPGNILGLNNDTAATPQLRGFATNKISLFDKTDNNLKKISDRVYKTRNVTRPAFEDFFGNILTLLKKRLTVTYSEDAIVAAFTAGITNPNEVALLTGDIKDAIEETANLVGYSQGIAAYNEQYDTNIATTQDALVELNEIYSEVSRIVAGAKARYIDDNNRPGRTPIKLSCIDNAYQLGPVGNGLDHLEDITGAPAQIIQDSAAASAYFYSTL
jgi:hypothetical protein